MSTSFTPGPWTVCNHSWSRTGIYADRRPVAALDISEATEDEADAEMAAMAADARLIAAAPAMLAMLQRIVAADDAALKDLATLGLDASAGPAALMTNEIRAVISLAIGSAS